MIKRTDELADVVFREFERAESGNESLDLTLNRVVVQIANGFETDVCSLYSREPETDQLLLVATVGLRQSCVGQLRMTLREGLVGLVAEERAPVVLVKAAEHPRFKYFPEADEDQYQSFLGVPVMDGDRLRGVLVVQTIESRVFSNFETFNLVNVATLLGPRLVALVEQ